METEKTINEIDERVAEKQLQKAAREQKLREVEGRELEINRDCDSVYALTQKS